MQNIEKNLSSVQAQIRQAEIDHARAPGSVSLLAVSKKKPASEIRAADTEYQPADTHNRPDHQ